MFVEVNVELKSILFDCNKNNLEEAEDFTSFSFALIKKNVFDKLIWWKQENKSRKDM